MQTHEATQVTRLQVPASALQNFAAWQAELQGLVASIPGFISLEIIAPSAALPPDWVLLERFISSNTLQTWMDSEERKHLFDSLSRDIKIVHAPAPYEQREGVTEVFVTNVHPEKVAAFREWLGKIHQTEAKFPGFKRAYVQAPSDLKNGNWITFLQFDTPENLDKWLSSNERKEVLSEAENYVHSLESHRIISSFAGWFGNQPELSSIPPLWKQTMLVLLVLFPVVMLEFKLLSPWTSSLNNLSLATFIGNAISVSLVSWPLLPIAIYFLSFWLDPKGPHRQRKETLGLAAVFFLYALEIAIFNL